MARRYAVGHDALVRRSLAELRGLVDAAKIAVFLAFLVDLALPWWTRSDPQSPPNGTATGWGSLYGDARGFALAALVAMAVVLVGAVFRTRWLSITAAVIAIGFSLLEMLEANREHGFGPGVFDAHAGLWLGYMIVLMGACLCIADAVLITRMRAAGQPSPVDADRYG